MQKIGYTQTSWDKGGPVFFFNDSDCSYRLRLAGNPLLLIEAYYNNLGGTDFMLTYKSVKEGIGKADKDNVEILKKAISHCEFFIDAIKELQIMKKSLLVIYKE